MAGSVVSPRYYRYPVTCPNTTPVSAPTSTSLAVSGTSSLESVRIVVPNGHAGLTGIRLDYSGETILPFSHPSTWLIGNSNDWLFDMGGFSITSKLTVVTYNTDVFDHSWEMHFKVIDFQAVGGQVGQPALAVRI